MRNGGTHRQDGAAHASLAVLGLDFDLNGHLHHSLKSCFEFGVQLGLSLITPQGYSQGVRLLGTVVIPAVDVSDDQKRGTVVG